MADEEILTPSGDTPPVSVVETPQVEEATPSLPEGEVKAVETPPEPEKPPKKERGVQRRIDELVRSREYYRGLAEGRQPASTAETEEIPGLVLPPEPQEDAFDDYGKYLKAVAQHGVQVEIAKENARRQQGAQQQSRQELIEAYSQWVEEGDDKFEGFGEIAEHVGGKITPHMGDAIRDSEYSHELVQYFYEHPKEITRLAKLSPSAAVREIIKLEGRVSQPPQLTTTKAPEKTAPGGGKETPGTDLADLPTDEYIAAREKKYYGA